jgi:TolB-like protein/predicted nucleic acid-binding Zn ribbon protein
MIVLLASILLWRVFPTKEENPTTTDVAKEKEISIAVLPFDNLSGDPDQEIMCDGLTEEIIHYLSKIKVFDKVTSRSSVMTFKDSEKTVPEIADLLAVNYILEGSYRQSANRLRITAQLIDASSDAHVWTEIYERPLGDIFDIQSDIAKSIAHNLKVELPAEESLSMATKPTHNLEAYNLYLKGRFFWHKRTEEDLKLSVNYINEALKLDSTFALALAGLADAYYIMAYWGWYPKDEGYELSKSLATRALLVNDKIAEAHATLAGLFIYHERNCAEAEREIKLAIKLNPNYATGHQVYAELLRILGRGKEARIEIDLALKNNPLSIMMHNISGWNYYLEKKFIEAIEEGQFIRQLNEGTRLGERWMLHSFFHLGNYNEVVQEVIRDISLRCEKCDTTEIKKIYQDEGIKGVLQYFIDLKSSGEKPNYMYSAQLSMLLDNKDEAIRWLELGYKKNSIGYHNIIRSHDFESLHSSNRFAALLKKSQLDKCSKYTD